MLARSVRHLLRASSAAIFAVLLCSASAQTLFQPVSGNTESVTLSTGANPLGVAVADFNHDGLPDLVVANNAANAINVYLATGPRTFSAPAVYPTCSGPTAIIATDLELSGLPAIAVTCKASNQLEVFLNLGNGTFNPTVNNTTNILLPTGMGPVSLVSGDFNRDGHPDLAVADTGDGTVTVFLSNSASNFTNLAISTISGLGTPTAVAAGIFGPLGHLSLAVTDSANSVVHILSNAGNGNFYRYPDVATQAGPNGIVSGDFNHDGSTDLAIVNSNAGTISVLFGSNNNTFKTSAPISFGPATGTGATSILALDVNDDGYLDILVGSTLQNQVALLMNNGNGTFQAAQDYAVSSPAYLAAGDFSGDGKPDLVVTQSGGAAVSVLMNNTLPTPVPGGRNFLVPHNLNNGFGNMADGVAVADFNHDGHADVAVSYLEDNTVQVLPGLGGGNFTTSHPYPVGQQPYAIVAGDLNHDGFADLITVNASVNEPHGTISILMNRAGGDDSFLPAMNVTVGRLPYGIAIGDLNGDGIPDLAVANYGENSLTVLYGPFGTSVPIAQSLSTCTNPYGVAIGDFRHTGQNDIALTCYGSNEIEVFLNNGMLPFQPPPPTTTFQSPVIYATDLRPTTLVLGDFNRDGRLDIVTGNSTANNVSFFGGNGDGTFAAPVTSFALNFPGSIAAGDLNGDGILDLAAVAPNNNEVTVLLGNGDGTFLPRYEFASGMQPWAIALADFNSDGKLDIVTANTFNRVNLTVPAYIVQYTKEFPPVSYGSRSLSILLNSSATNVAFSASPSSTVVYGSAVTFTATVTPTPANASPAPTGTVTFQDPNGTSSSAVPLANGSASFTTSTLAVGRHQITVLYSGDVNYQPNTATGPSFVVNVTSTQ